MHVDFLRVGANSKLDVEVHVTFINEEASPGLKRGGTLNIVRHTVEVTAPNDAIPEEIVVDLTGTEIGDSIHISAVKLPKGVTPTITDRDFTIATIVAPSALKSSEGGEAEAGSCRVIGFAAKFSAMTIRGGLRAASSVSGDVSMKLLVGLGNPGDQYRGNRHNIGFMAVDAIAREYGFSPWKSKYSGLLAEGQIGGERVLLLKPQTFMNRSGDSVQQVANFYKIDPADITVLYDELDLAAGKVRVKVGGGNGGHNGLRSIDPADRPQLPPRPPRHRPSRLQGPGHPPCAGRFRQGRPALARAPARRRRQKRRHAAQGRRQRLHEQDRPRHQIHADEPAPGKARRPKAQSHIRQARPTEPQAACPKPAPWPPCSKSFSKRNKRIRYRLERRLSLSQSLSHPLPSPPTVSPRRRPGPISRSRHTPQGRPVGIDHTTRGNCVNPPAGRRPFRTRALTYRPIRTM